MKKVSAVMEKWGYVLLVMVCVGVIFFSALWTKRDQATPPSGMQALSDESQRLAEWTPPPSPPPDPAIERPVLRGFSSVPVYFSQTRVWQTHESVDYLFADGQMAAALRGGRVRVEEKEVWVTRGDTSERYRGLKQINVKTGQEIKAGDIIGLCGGPVPFEGKGHLCVTFYRNGIPYDFEAEQEP